MLKSDNFFWGAATSAHQIEGGNKNDFSEGGLDAGRACDSYHRYEEDFEIAKSLGQNSHRFSIEWSRVEPEEGKFDPGAIAHYRKVIAALRQRGLEPFVTLWHFTNPVWFAKLGGWADPSSVGRFSRYAHYLTEQLKDSVKFWITLNEPEVYADVAYVRKRWPPGEGLTNSDILQNIGMTFTALRVLKNFREAHKVVYHVIKHRQPESQVGIVTSLIGGNPLTRWALNFPNFQTLRCLRRHTDFIGLNYYMKVSFWNHIFGLRSKEVKLSDLGWEIYPEGIYQNLLALKRFGKPVYITENGLADAADKYRADFIKDHIHWMKKAMAGGADVRGYFHWSLLDNFEWDKGFTPRFGLVEMNYETLARHVRPSARIYAELIKKFPEL